MARVFDPRLTLAIAGARAASLGIRLAKRGGGTAAPGVVATRVDPALLTKISARLEHGSIVVAGTNGKTTTSRMIADMLEANGAKVLHNRSGSNLVRGVASAFTEQTGFRGQPAGDTGVIEADEAAFPEIVRLVQPRFVLLNNLFRDQLDRYGELNTIATKWRRALETLPSTTTIVVNVDDPTLSALTDGLVAQRVTFGIDPGEYRLDALPHAADAAVCRRCQTDLVYDSLSVSHLGAWRCPKCGLARPELDIEGREIRLQGVESLGMTIAGREIEVGVPGLYNAYNAVAAYASATSMGVPPATAATALAAFKSAFGRIERVVVRGRTITIALVKNPVGFNEVLRMLAGSDGGLTVPVMIAINDNHADGRDVSWLWDVDFERLASGTAPLFTTGVRGSDMANRLKYAGIPLDRITPLPDALQPALDRFVDQVPEGGTAYILPTYTAMLELRQVLATLGAVDAFWKQ